MSGKAFNEKALNQLFKYNLPYRKCIDDSYVIDVSVRETINGDLFFTCPFCLNRRKKNCSPYQNSKSIIHFYGNTLGMQTPRCDEASIKYWDLPRFKFNLIEQGTAPYVDCNF